MLSRLLLLLLLLLLGMRRRILLLLSLLLSLTLLLLCLDLVLASRQIKFPRTTKHTWAIKACSCSDVMPRCCICR